MIIPDDTLPCLLFFSVDGEEEENMTLSGVFGCPPWFEEVKSEYWACRTGVCLIDMSTFTKFELRVRLLKWV